MQKNLEGVKATAPFRPALFTEAGLKRHAEQYFFSVVLDFCVICIQALCFCVFGGWVGLVTCGVLLSVLCIQPTQAGFFPLLHKVGSLPLM